MDGRTVDYLATLPAVGTSTGRRIVYTGRFKHRVADGCRRGESPVRSVLHGLGVDV